MDKKETENKITELVTQYEKDTGLEVSFVNIDKQKGVGFNPINTTLAKIIIKN